MNPNTMPLHATHNGDTAANFDRCDPFSFAKDPSDSWSVSTDPSSAPSDGEGSLSDDDVSASLGPLRPARRSVRFSSVRVREYSVVEEPAAAADGMTAVRPDGMTVVRHRSLGWDYTETGTCDLDVHLDGIKNAKKEHYLNLIQNHMQRAEREKEERERNKLPKKNKGFRSKVLKPMWKGTIVAANRFAMVVPSACP